MFPTEREKSREQMSRTPYCKQQKIASSREVNTLAGTYTSTEIVIMCNLRLPEFDKNRNVNQQKAHLYFSQRLAMM
jgi:hypothetical protein